MKRVLSALSRHRRALEAAFALALLVAALAALHRLGVTVRFGELRAAAAAIPAWRIAAALVLTVASYTALTFCDVLALRTIGRPQPYSTAGLASFISYSLSHNLGLGLLTGGSARLRTYGAAGLSPAEVARVIAVASGTFWAGVVVVGAAALALHQQPLAVAGWSLSPGWQRAAGIGGLALAALAIGLLGTGERRLAIGKLELPLPSRPQAMAQVVVAASDLVAASAALFVLVPRASPAEFPLFFLVYTMAVIVALLSHVPGGVGVFEAAILSGLQPAQAPPLIAALVAYRAIYYLLPLSAAAVLLAWHERRHWRAPLSAAAQTSRLVGASLLPALLAALSAVGGVVLLASGALPGEAQRLALLRDLVPLPFAEASHVAASLSGTGLLLLAPALYRRLDAAFVLTRALLLAGAAFSLVKGIDYEEATVLLLIATLLQAGRGCFYRRTALVGDALSPRWLAAVAQIFALSIGLGLFAYRHVAYQQDLWWAFAWHGDASRFLRASFAAAVLLTMMLLLRLFGPAAPPALAASAAPDFARALTHAGRSDSLLAFTGDKRFLCGPEGRSFLMYQVQGRSWIAMGDPVGPREDWPDLLWRLREAADTAQGYPLLYQISAEALPLAVDLGLQIYKYGEEARIDTAAFSLAGASGKSLRHAVRRAERDGAVFEIVAAAEVPRLLLELRAVSDAWLAGKGHQEKRFSVGWFDEAYICRWDVAVVRCDGRIVAFANLWRAGDGGELSVDLMRHAADAPYGTMDFLFVQLIAWARDHGYPWFNIGIAPLSGVVGGRLAPLWARAGALAYRYGKRLYAFDGLRAYKEKFVPTWRPVYIAGSPGLSITRALLDLNQLISGGGPPIAMRASPAPAAQPSPNWRGGKRHAVNRGPDAPIQSEVDAADAFAGMHLRDDPVDLVKR